LIDTVATVSVGRAPFYARPAPNPRPRNQLHTPAREVRLCSAAVVSGACAAPRIRPRALTTNTILDEPLKEFSRATQLVSLSTALCTDQPARRQHLARHRWITFHPLADFFGDFVIDA
jgi:hypothetical protein